MKNPITPILCAMLIAACTANGNTAKPQPVSVHENPAATQKYEGSITGYDTKTFTFHAQAGQKIDIGILTNTPYAYFNVFAPDRDEAIFNSSLQGDRFEKTAEQTGEYKVLVYQMRASARRNQTVPYYLKINVQ